MIVPLPSLPEKHSSLVFLFCMAFVSASPCLAQSDAPSAIDVRGQFPPEHVEELLPARSDSLDAVYRPMPADDLPAWHDMVTNLPGDWGRSLQMTFSSSSFPTLLGLSAVTAAFLMTDHPTCEASRSLYARSESVRWTSNEFVMLGDGRQQFILAGAFAAYGFVASDHRALRTASQTVEALLACGLAVQTLKRISGRESPQAASSYPGKWKPFPSLKEYQQHQIRYYAFPSGHIATAMAAVTVVTENYAEVGWLKPAGYGIVGLIGMSLVNKGYHWYSDLPLGLVIGHMFGTIASHPSTSGEAGQSEGRSVKFMLSPAVSPNGSAVSVAMVF